MSNPPKTSTVTNYRLTAAVAEKRIRALAVETGNIQWGVHTLERMNERGIFDVVVLRVLRQGFCTERPILTERGEWKAKMIHKVSGAREVGAIVIILKANKLFVKTVEWEDLK